jgi:Flp pilus assembly protein TadD
MELDSTYFLLHYLLARAHARRGALAKAGAILKKIGENFDKIRLIAMGAGLVHAVTARKIQARAVLRRLRAQANQRYIPATYIGTLCAATGDTEAAFEWLEKAYEERADGLTLLNVEPMVDALRPDPRFQSLIRRIGLNPAET